MNQGGDITKSSILLQLFQHGSWAMTIRVEEEFNIMMLRGNPEDDLNSVAFHAAVSELISIALGKVGFVCATVVLLSGYYGHLETFHFWVVATLLIIKAARLLTSQHELHLRTKVVQSDSYWRSRSLETNRDFSCENEECKIRSQYLPQRHKIKGMDLNAVLHVMQVLAAMLCVFLSVAGDIKVKDSGLEGVKQSVPVLLIFYSAVLAESLIFVSGRACWQRRKKFLTATTRKLKLQEEHAYFLNQYAYYVYCKCMGSSIFEGTHFSLLDFTIMKISSDVNEEKHSSVVIMERILGNKHSLKVVKVFAVLLEIVSWDNCRVILPPENICKARHAAANILLQVVKWCPTSCYTLASIPGAFEAIFTLFGTHTCGKHGVSSTQEELPLQGLRILNDMAKNPKNIMNMGFVHNLMNTLSAYLENSEGVKLKEKKKALQLLNKLVQTEHKKQISKFAVENLCGMVREEADFSLKKLAICILVSLAMDGNARDEIGCTGYIISTLCNLFLVKVNTDSMSGCENGKRVKNQHKVRQYAGNALYLLSHEEPNTTNKNWRRMLGHMPGYEKGNLIKFINLLSEADMKIRIRSTKILSNFLRHTESKWPQEALLSALEKSLKMMDRAFGMDDLILHEQQEAALHLLTCLVPHLELEKLQQIANRAELLEIISLDKRPNGVPCLRRHAVAVIVILMQKDVNLMHAMRGKGMIKMLKNLIKTISGSENVCTELVQEKRGVHHIIWEERSGESIEELITRGLSLLEP